MEKILWHLLQLHKLSYFNDKRLARVVKELEFVCVFTENINNPLPQIWKERGGGGFKSHSSKRKVASIGVEGERGLVQYKIKPQFLGRGIDIFWNSHPMDSYFMYSIL